MGTDAAQILRQEMVHHHDLELSNDCDDCVHEDNRYFDWTGHNERTVEGWVCITHGLNIVLSDLETLSMFPRGAEEAFGWLFEPRPMKYGYTETRFEQLHDSDLLLPEGRKEMMMKMDTCLLVLIRAAIRDASEQSKLWDPSKLRKIFRDARESHVQDRFYKRMEKLWEKVFILERDPCFVRSLEYISHWHSRGVAEFLVKRVAGDRLPAELIEMIEEYFYDPKELAALDAVAIRASESAYDDCGLIKPILVRTEKWGGDDVEWYV